MKRILIIDDEKMLVEVIRIVLEDLGYQVTGFDNPLEGQKAAIEQDFDLILVDLRMPDRDGAAVTESIMAQKPEALVLIITAYPEDPLVERALTAGARALLRKPFEITKIFHFLGATDHGSS